MKSSLHPLALPALLLLASLIPVPSATDTGPLGLPSFCGFRWATWLPCPVCGLTRSLVCACHGQFARAFWFHPLGPVLWAGLVAGALWPLLRRVPVLRNILDSIAVKTWTVGIGAGLLLVIWAARLLQVLPSPP